MASMQKNYIGKGDTTMSLLKLILAEVVVAAGTIAIEKIGEEIKNNKEEKA